MPKPVSGSSATVFSLIGADGRKRTAVKCFTRHVSDREYRYQKISEHLAQVDDDSLSQSWKMDFEYLSDGILVDGVRYPILKMNWVDGIHLSKWLSTHHQDQAAVAEIAQKFVELMNDLYRNNIAHGDLQHGNLLVADDRTLRLVDYDGLFVPALAGERGNEIGHRNYQSPRRTLDDFGPDMDNFSAWVIYASLSSVAADPAIWSQMHDAESECLILSGDDFSDPASSAHFPGLLRHPNDEVNASMGQLALLCEDDYGEIPRLDLKLSTGMDEDLHSLGESAAGGVSDVQPGSPSWLDGHLEMSTAAQNLSVASFRGWYVREFLLALLGVLTIFGPLTAGMTNYLDSHAIIFGFFVMSSLFLTLSAATRSGRSEVAMFRNSQRSLDQLIAFAVEASASYAAANEESARLVENEQERIEGGINQNQELTRHLHRTYARIESTRNSAVEAIDQELRSLRAEKERAVADKLHPFQEPWVREKLPSFLISEAHLSGITSKNIASLVALEIHAASDIVGVKRTKSGEDALLITREGTSVKVPGIGPAKANALYLWRHQCAKEARASCPVRLPAHEEKEIEDIFEHQFESITAQRAIIDEEAERKRIDARRELAVTRTRLADLHQEEIAALRAKQAELDLRIVDIRANAAEVYHLTQTGNLLKIGARNISYLRYLRFLYLR